MLWVGFIGASMATKEGAPARSSKRSTEFVWKGKAKAHVGPNRGAQRRCLSASSSAGSASTRLRLEYSEIRRGGGRRRHHGAASRFRASPTSVLPFAFAVMTPRFLGRGLGETEKGECAIAPLKLDDAPPPAAPEEPRSQILPAPLLAVLLLLLAVRTPLFVVIGSAAMLAFAFFVEGYQTLKAHRTTTAVQLAELTSKSWWCCSAIPFVIGDHDGRRHRPGRRRRCRRPGRSRPARRPSPGDVVHGLF